MSQHLVVVTTLPSEEESLRLARSLLEKGLVASVNIIPRIRSLYRWKGAFEEARESLLFMKTRADRFESLSAAIAEIHPYEVPQLLALPVANGSESYLAWIDECLSPGLPDRTE